MVNLGPAQDEACHCLSASVGERGLSLTTTIQND